MHRKALPYQMLLYIAHVPKFTTDDLVVRFGSHYAKPIINNALMRLKNRGFVEKIGQLPGSGGPFIMRASALAIRTCSGKG